MRHTLLLSSLTLMLAAPLAAQDRPQVIAVNYPLQYFAERLLGDSADVSYLVPSDVDPSFWRPSISDISTVQAADLVLLNGAGFAQWIDRVSLSRGRLVNTTAAVEDSFIVTESITHSHGEGEEHSHEGLATYVWLDPSLAIAQSEAIANAITSRGLAEAEVVEARLESLRSDLEALAAETEDALARLDNTAIIATHPRYDYLAERFGLSITSLEWEAGAVPTDEELDDLRRRAQDTGATILLWEAAPPLAAFDLTSNLGLTNVVFPPLAHAANETSFIESYLGAVAELSAAAAP